MSLFAVGLLASLCTASPARADTPTISGPSNTEVVEGYVATTEVTIPVTVTGTHDALTVDWATVNGTAKAFVPPRLNDDYVAASGTLVFGPTDSEQDITLLVRGDGRLENNEYFTIALSNATGGAVISMTPIRVTILNDEMPILRFGPAAPTPLEGATVTFTVRVSNPTIFSVVVQVVTDPFNTGTATSVFDYGVVNQWITIPAETIGPVKVKVPIYKDGLPEPDEQFTVWAASQETINQFVIRTVTIPANVT